MDTSSPLHCLILGSSIEVAFLVVYGSRLTLSTIILLHCHLVLLSVSIDNLRVVTSLYSRCVIGDRASTSVGGVTSPV